MGVVNLELDRNGRGPTPLYVMVSPPGHPAELAFSYDGVIAHVIGGVGGDFHLTAEAIELLAKFPILAIDTNLWGVPSDPGHDSQRFGLGCATLHGCSMGAAFTCPLSDDAVLLYRTDGTGGDCDLLAGIRNHGEATACRP